MLICLNITGIHCIVLVSNYSSQSHCDLAGRDFEAGTSSSSDGLAPLAESAHARELGGRSQSAGSERSHIVRGRERPFLFA
jgi:hypothetical protein